MNTRPTRRQLLAGGMGVAATIAGLPPSAAQAAATGPTGPTLPPWVQDENVLLQLLSAEATLQYGCEQAAGSAKLGPDSDAVVTRLLAHSQAHMAALESHLQALRLRPGGSAQQIKPPAPLPPQQIVQLFNNINTETAALQGLVQVENLSESSYFVAVGSFHDLRLVQLAAEILANHAQHWTVLVALLHRGRPTEAVPHPFVRGSQHIGTPHTTTS